MSQTNHVQEMSWTAFEEQVKKTALAIIPCGAVEVYGRHLPLGTDTLVAIKLAEAAAERVEALIGPPVWAGQSSELADFTGTLSVRAESFKEYLRDIALGLMKWGVRDFLFINSHLGNVAVIDQLSADLMQREGVRCAQVDTWRYVRHFCGGVIETGPAAHGHASETGTSVMLHLYPGLCDMRQAAVTPEPVDRFPEIITYPPFRSLTDTGTLGDATCGTAEKGAVLFARMTDKIVSFLIEEWDTPKKNP